ncbi:sulfite exporter TauE/SafE family protein [Streptomyces albofaciens]|uniref:sulfite exporter TauE/SafE family protein n=1 Tax=Streptomyces albofaciens TaxID=66866 RepID=UPI001FCC536D|nr:sulfite exporter TauE/SafE family protein [Streptomyces albofaciens]
MTALPCGLVIGLLLGALGGGGSILAVPALVYLLHQSPHEATAGALVVVGIGAASGLACHARAGRVRWAAGAAFGGLGTAGTYLGSRWSAALDPTVLMTAFAGLMLAVAAVMLVRTWREREKARPTEREKASPTERDKASPTERKKASPTEQELAHPAAQEGEPSAVQEGEPSAVQEGEPPAVQEGEPPAARKKTRPVPHRSPIPSPIPSPTPAPTPAPPPTPTPATRLAPALRIGATATAVGLLTGFFGVGGGFVVVPALTLVLGLEMPVAVGTSLLVILVNSVTAFATRAGAGGLDWPLLASFAACAALGSWLGNRLAARVRPQALSTAFASLVTVLAISMAVTSIPRL